ncbi:hypothetical protein [Stenotrophomonas maltophilia]|uniref:hypothetical protein n=1 Tax=Stenotrophomonas maltophilia TaxID=40324 RepID=UPI000C15D8FB|nr:hypothetical protein [Stenotrophomonas maltophilia]
MPQGKTSDFKPVYEQRFILFLDFLGFKNIIRETVSDEKRIAEVIDAISIIKDMGGSKDSLKSKVVTQFSDSIVISYRCDEPSAAFDLVSEIGFALVRLVERGFLVRGAVAIGDLIHTEQYLLGPAMVEVYELESKCAIFPRVLISEGLLDVAKGAPAPHHDGEEEADYIAKYLKQDSDGLYYIDYLSWNGVVHTIGGDNELFPRYLGKVADIIKKGLTSKTPDVIQKYSWIRARYMEVVKSVCEMPEDNEWVLSYPDEHRYIKGLPTTF